MTRDDQIQLRRWRLILGAAADESLTAMSQDGGILLSNEEAAMDAALAAIYDETYESLQGGGGARSAGLGKSSPRLAQWLGDVRSLFPADIVSVIQTDAIERKGLKQLLLEPEILSQVKPDIHMAATLMSLKGQIPEKAKEAARRLVRSVVDDIMKRMEQELRRAVTGALNRRQHSPLPSASGLDWKTTIRRNLRNYDRERQMLVPEKVYFFDRSRRSKEWTVILDIDQSGSMAGSVIYASLVGSIFASMPALDTRVVVFDTEVVDLTETCAQDPVDMLFGIQLGGGTDINKSISYCEQFIREPNKTLFILVSDLFEGGNQAEMIRRLGEMKQAGVKAICLLALSDEGNPSYDENVAKRLAKFDIPCFGCSPNRLPELVEGALKGMDLQVLADRLTM
ncbi:VWA domain-containing protein [Cohnella fermenti]|uniref:VWA domain-containing protein n=1 Tax=Cohnella fermenti TaxID=2565925 RepID=A0A4S4C8R6_9BACL|nr:VWA domain-containing protein [Cohnella fermenti]THF84430.1 VWA domain-containing protein [Cohnella fermenti]